MKPKFLVNGLLANGDDHGIEVIETPMLQVAQFAGIRISSDYNSLVKSSEGRFHDALVDADFTGDLGQSAVVSLRDLDLPQKYLAVIGLGRAQQFSCKAVREMARATVNAACVRRVSRVTIPVLPHRTSAANLTLNQSAHIMKCVIEDLLGQKKSDRELEIEFVCTPQAVRHLKKGLDRRRRCRPCQTKAKS